MKFDNDRTPLFIFNLPIMLIEVETTRVLKRPCQKGNQFRISVGQNTRPRQAKKRWGHTNNKTQRHAHI